MPFQPTATTSTTTIDTVPEELRCRYPSKRCEQIRAVKRDGDLHRFCDLHRQRANLNQQRLEQRRRMSNEGPRKRYRRSVDKSGDPPNQDHGDDAYSHIESYVESFETALPPFDLDDLDFEIFQELFDLELNDHLPPPDFAGMSLPELVRAASVDGPQVEW